MSDLNEVPPVDETCLNRSTVRVSRFRSRAVLLLAVAVFSAVTSYAAVHQSSEPASAHPLYDYEDGWWSGLHVNIWTNGEEPETTECDGQVSCGHDPPRPGFYFVRHDNYPNMGTWVCPDGYEEGPDGPGTPCRKPRFHIHLDLPPTTEPDECSEEQHTHDGQGCHDIGDCHNDCEEPQPEPEEEPAPPPSSPSLLSARCIGAFNVSLAWEEASDISAYQVQVRRLPADGDDWDTTLLLFDREHDISVKPNLQYQFRARVRSAASQLWSDWSDAELVRCNQRTRSRPPRPPMPPPPPPPPALPSLGVPTVTLTCTADEVTGGWQPGDPPGTGYDYTLRAATPEGSAEREVVAAQDTPATMLREGSEPDTEYTLEVRASGTFGGMSVTSDWVSETCVTRPVLPADMTATLTCVEGDTTNLFVQAQTSTTTPAGVEYRLEWVQGASGGGEPMPVAGTEASVFSGGTEYSLVAGETMYQFAVRAVRVFSDGAEAESDTLQSNAVTCPPGAGGA